MVSLRHFPDYLHFVEITLEKLRVTPERRDEIRAAKQGSDKWIGHRYGRLTASNFGSAVGHNKFCTPRELLGKMLWPSYYQFDGNAATRHGSNHEPVAREAYKAWMLEMTESDGVTKQLIFDEPGLTVSIETPWLAMSPDGEIEVQCFHQPPWAPSVYYGLIEYKCPFRDRPYMNPSIPDYYFDQMQGQMAVDGKARFCDFVVWTSKELVVRRVAFNSDYWIKELFPALNRFYFDEFLPRLYFQSRNKLRTGEIDPYEPIPGVLMPTSMNIMIVSKSPCCVPKNENENSESKKNTKIDTDSVHRRLAALYGNDLSKYPASIVISAPQSQSQEGFDENGNVIM